MVVLLLSELDLNGVKEIAIKNGLLLDWQDLALVGAFIDKEPVAQMLLLWAIWKMFDELRLSARASVR